jgi:hypothetical protein
VFGRFDLAALRDCRTLNVFLFMCCLFLLLLLWLLLLLLQAYITALLRRSQDRAWAAAHGRLLAPPQLSPVIVRTIREWFELVDDDGSGTLEHHELLTALQVGTWDNSSSSRGLEGGGEQQQRP